MSTRSRWIRSINPSCSFEFAGTTVGLGLNCVGAPLVKCCPSRASSILSDNTTSICIPHTVSYLK